MSDTTERVQETVTRFRQTAYEMSPGDQGDWVRFTDYEVLAARLAEVEAERDEWKSDYDLESREVANWTVHAEAAEARIVQMTVAWGEDVVRIEELTDENAKLHAEVARLKTAQGAAVEAWPSVLALIRDYDEAFPCGALEGDDEKVTRLHEAFRILAQGDST